MAKKEQYILKKFVTAENASAALALDGTTEVTEVFLVSVAPRENLAPAIGFNHVYPEAE